MPTDEILRVWDELLFEEISDEDSTQERPVPSGLPRPVRWDELFQELRHRGISEHFIQVLYAYIPVSLSQPSHAY